MGSPPPIQVINDRTGLGVTTVGLDKWPADPVAIARQRRGLIRFPSTDCYASSKICNSWFME